MTRAELEQLDRDALIARAEEAGVTRARVLTRPELVDELLLRSSVDALTKQRARGFFGLARDLLARVVERGLNLPDAAETIRALGIPPPSRPPGPAAVPTVTLAEIYAAQGHRDRAIETLEGVLTAEPEHTVARTLLARLEDTTHPIPPPPMPPEEEEPAAPAASASDEEPSVAAVMEGTALVGAVQSSLAEPSHMLDDAPLPPRYDVDECVAMPVDPRTVYVYWEVRDGTLADARMANPEGVLAVRLVVIVPTWEGPRSSVRDREVSGTLGDLFEHDLPDGCVVRAAVGWKTEGAFFSLAHAASLETPPGSPSPLLADGIVRWTPEGAVAAGPLDRDASSIEEVLGLARQKATLGRIAAHRGGSSERWMRA
jgi:hypothetical protein